MTKKRETRRAPVRAAKGDKPGVTLKPITPHTVDDWGSVFMPDAFDESIAKRMPVLTWGHDWAEPLGPGRMTRTMEDGSPEIDFEFSDFTAVPMARRAHAQVQDGTIVDCSVGFSDTKRRDPTDDEMVMWPGCREVITKASLDEVALVLRGAVPGAKVLSVRSGGKIDLDAVVELARRVSAGEITQAEAQVAADLLSIDEPEGEVEAETPPPPEPAADMTADIDAALATIGRSARLGFTRASGDLSAADKAFMTDMTANHRQSMGTAKKFLGMPDKHPDLAKMANHIVTQNTAEMAKMAGMMKAGGMM